jgi:hypothetical protein
VLESDAARARELILHEPSPENPLE